MVMHQRLQGFVVSWKSHALQLALGFSSYTASTNQALYSWLWKREESVVSGGKCVSVVHADSDGVFLKTASENQSESSISLSHWLHASALRGQPSAEENGPVCKPKRVFLWYNIIFVMIHVLPIACLSLLLILDAFTFQSYSLKLNWWNSDLFLTLSAPCPLEPLSHVVFVLPFLLGHVFPIALSIPVCCSNLEGIKLCCSCRWH